MSLSEDPNTGQSRALDEVRAKIFYLASDVELASQPAAMLLRAVAESIGDAPEAGGRFNGHVALKSLASLGYTRANGVHPTPRVRDVPLPAQHAEAESSRSGHKR